MNQNNGNHRHVGQLNVVEDVPSPSDRIFYDSNDPSLRPAKQVPAKRRSWKRETIKWCFVMLLIVGGALALYLVTTVNRVRVRVQADSTPKSAKQRGENNGDTESGLTSDAINIARE